MAELCIHDLDRSWCSLCKQRPRPEPLDAVEFTFKARYESQCPECNLPLYVDQEAAMLASGKVIHRACM